MKDRDRPDTYWDDRGQGNLIKGYTRGLAGTFAGVVPEALPSHEDGEVEIVLIKMRSTTGDLMSLRASRCGDVIAYRMVDEYEMDQVVIPPQSEQPLSFGELKDLLWSFIRDDSDVAEFIGSWQYQRNELAEAFDEISEWYELDSDYYDGLDEWLDERFEQWKEITL